MRFRRLQIGVLILSMSAAAKAADMVISSVGTGNEGFAGKIYRVTPTGQTTLLMQNLGQPHGVAIDAQLNIYFAESNGDRIRKITPQGVSSILYQFDSPQDNPEGLTLGLDGSLLVSGTIDSPDIVQANKVYRITPGGTGSVYATAGNRENLGIVADFTGNVFVSDLGDGGAIWKIDSNQQATRIAENLGFATGLTITPDQQRLLVSDSMGARILSVPIAGGPGTVFANIADPWGLAFNGSDLYVGQVSKLSRITPDGTQTVVLTGITDIRGIAVVPEPGLICFGMLVGLALIRRTRSLFNTASTAHL